MSLSAVLLNFVFCLAFQTTRGDMKRRRGCDCGTGMPAGHSATTALQDGWVKWIWPLAINIRDFEWIWNLKAEIRSVRAGLYVQTKLNWMSRLQLWQRNQTHKSKSAFCLSDPLVMLIILCPFTVSNTLGTLNYLSDESYFPFQIPWTSWLEIPPESKGRIGLWQSLCSVCSSV